jgi:hypothetical protein
MIPRLPLWALVALLTSGTALLSACGGGGGGSAHTVPAAGSTPGSVAPQGSATATFALSLRQYTPVQTAATRRRVAFISPATAQISLTIVSVNGVATSGSPMTFPISPGAPNCTGANGAVNCNISATIPIGSDVLSASTLDVNGHTLGTSTITANVEQNATNVIALAIGGQIANVQIYLSQNHFTPGTPGTANVIVVPLDQSGAEIVNPGNYSPAITVTSSSSAGGHLSLITNGTNTGLTSTVNSPNDQVVVSYDGGGTSGSSSITANAGGGITATKPVSINAAVLAASPRGPQVVSSTTGYVFTAAGQQGTIATSGGTGPYSVTTSDATLATVSPTSGSGSFTITAVGYGVSGSAIITVTDSASAVTTIPVTFSAAPITLTPGTCGGSSCLPTGVSYTIPLSGPPGSLTPTPVTATGGTGTFSYFFISSGTMTSAYVNVSQTGGLFTITPSGLGNDALVVTSGNRQAYFAITASADAFGQSLPRAIGMVLMVNQSTGKTYNATLPATVSGITGGAPVPPIAGFNFNPGNPSSIDATPATAANGTITFTNNFAGSTVVPYTVFGLAFPTYPGAGASLNSEPIPPTVIPADEAFTGPGETETVTVTGLTAGVITASSSNTGVVSVGVPSASTVLVSSVAAGTATITLKDIGNGAVATYSVSVTTTTIPIASTQRQP